MGVPEELIKNYTVSLKRNGQTVRTIDVKDNHQRLNVLKFDSTACDAVDITVHSTNGCGNAVIFEVRVYEA